MGEGPCWRECTDLLLFWAVFLQFTHHLGAASRDLFTPNLSHFPH